MVFWRSTSCWTGEDVSNFSFDVAVIVLLRWNCFRKLFYPINWLIMSKLPFCAITSVFQPFWLWPRTARGHRIHVDTAYIRAWLTSTILIFFIKHSMNILKALTYIIRTDLLHDDTADQTVAHLAIRFILSRLAITFVTLWCLFSIISLLISGTDLSISTIDLHFWSSELKLDTLLSGMACHS